MAHSHSYPQAEEKLTLGAGSKTWMIAGLIVGIVGLIVAFVTAGMGTGTGSGIRRFWFAYLIGFAYFLSFALGGLFFVLVQYVVRAGWSINVRRVPEAMARTLPLFLVLSLPLVYTIIQNDGLLYRWAQPNEEGHGHGGHGAAHATNAATGGEGAAGHHDAGQEKAVENNASVHAGTGETTAGMNLKDHKTTRSYSDAELGNAPGAYPIQDPMPLYEDGKPLKPDGHLVAPKKEQFLLLKPMGVIVKVLFSLTLLSVIAYWYTGKSRRQDETGDKALTETLNKRAAPMLVIFGLTLTGIAIDLFMSLDPKFFSTMFGPYYFAGCAISVHAFTILILKYLQGNGYLKNSVGRDHFHDLSKWQFAFTFFWGYLAFSQFMLLWYASIPEEIEWLARRGASTAHTHLETFGAYTVVALILLFCKLLIPFPGLLSRHVKRNNFGIMFWAAWILLAHLVDIYWIVMPELDGKFHLGLPELGGVLGVGGLFVAVFTWALGGAALRPVKDPRAPESLAFHQSF